jgi:hypothetical protein
MMCASKKYALDFSKPDSILISRIYVKNGERCKHQCASFTCDRELPPESGWLGNGGFTCDQELPPGSGWLGNGGSAELKGGLATEAVQN